MQAAQLQLILGEQIRRRVRTEFHPDGASISRRPWENLCVYLDCLPRIRWKEGEKYTSCLCFRREWVEDCGDVREKSSYHDFN